MKMKSLQDLYVDQLRDTFSAEQQITTALPQMQERAEHPELKAAFAEHLAETEGQIERLRQIAATLDIDLDGETCEGMAGIIAEGERMIGARGDEAVRDAALIAIAQHVEHYEMASYGCLRTWASLLGREADVTLLQRSLDEEGATDQRLTMLAEQVVNVEAMAAG